MILRVLMWHTDQPVIGADISPLRSVKIFILKLVFVQPDKNVVLGFFTYKQNH